MSDMMAKKQYDDSFEGMRNYTGDWAKAIYDRQTLILEGIKKMSAQTDALTVAVTALGTKVDAVLAANADLTAQVASHAADDAAVQANTDAVNAIAAKLP